MYYSLHPDLFVPFLTYTCPKLTVQFQNFQNQWLRLCKFSNQWIRFNFFNKLKTRDWINKSGRWEYVSPNSSKILYSDSFSTHYLCFQSSLNSS